MTFIHAYLLGGLVLAGVPVLLHLILRQKPKRLPFPAFQFLRQRHRITQRKLRLQHLLLLALRVLVIAVLCLALARPLAFSERLGGRRKVDAVLVLDTSPSMEYEFGGRSRLEEVQRRAEELLDMLADDSRVAVLDSGEAAGGGFVSKGEARERIQGLQIRPANGPLNP